MAQFEITVDEADLSKVFSGQGLSTLVKQVLNQVLAHQVTAALKAQPGEREATFTPKKGLDMPRASDAPLMGNFAREHWGVENRLHWVLDVGFREDDCRVRVDHGGENLAILRHFCVNLLSQERTSKVGVKNRRLRAGWDDTFLERILTN